VKRPQTPPPLVLLEALKFLDEVELELDGNPRRELERDVLVRVSAAIAPSLRHDANGPRALNPLLRREDEAVQPGLNSNPIEFDGVKSRVVEPLPDAQELDGVPISEPVRDEVVGSLCVFETGDVGEANVVVLPLRHDADDDALNFDGGFGRLFHARKGRWRDSTCAARTRASKPASNGA
jgi:hypothetical protein